MRQITMDTSSATSHDLKEQIALAYLFLDQDKADQVSWDNKKYGCSVTVSGQKDNFVLSFGNKSTKPSQKAKLLVENLFGKPDKEYSKKSIVTEGLYIHYMVWKNA